MLQAAKAIIINMVCRCEALQQAAVLPECLGHGAAKLDKVLPVFTWLED